MNFSEQEWKAAQSQMADADPEQLKAQARMMKNMDKNTVRRMNPQFATMSGSEVGPDGESDGDDGVEPGDDEERDADDGRRHKEVPEGEPADLAWPGRHGGGYRKGDRVELPAEGAAEHNGKQGTVVGPRVNE